MPESIADYEVISSWADARRHVARPPARIGHAGPVLVLELAADGPGWSSLCDDLTRVARLRAPGLLAPIEAGSDQRGDRPFLVTEMAEPAARPTSPVGAAEAVAGAARAVHSMHEAGLAYGPIAPSALLRAERGLVLDLPPLDAPPGEIVAEATLDWISVADSEILGGEPPTRHSDIWALGALLHLLTSERPLYPGIEADETVIALQRVLFTRPVIDPSLPGPLGALIGRCLSPDPADRPPNALWVAEHLEAAYPLRSGT